MNKSDIVICSLLMALFWFIMGPLWFAELSAGIKRKFFPVSI